MSLDVSVDSWRGSDCAEEREPRTPGKASGDKIRSKTSNLSSESITYTKSSSSSFVVAG